MISAGYGDIPTDQWLIAIVTVLITIMFIGGVTATLYFLARPSAGGAESPTLGPGAA